MAIQAPSKIESTLQDERSFDFLTGLWTGKKAPFTEAAVIRNTNFRNDGKIDFSNIAILKVETKQLQTRKLRCGDIIIERSGGGPKQPVGRVVYFDKESSNLDFSLSNFTSAIRVKDNGRFDSRYVFYFLHNFYLEGNTDQLQRRTTGIRNLDFSFYKESIVFPLLKIAEQKKIAHVLTTIQNAIAEQEKLIAKLQEFKRSMMQHLFTYGTKDEKTKMTEIGEAPESWAVVDFESLCVLQRGKDLTKNNFKKGSVPVAGSNGIIGYHETSNTKAPAITVGRSGSVGEVKYYDQDIWAHNTALYVKDFKGNDERFTGYYLEYLKLSRFKGGASVPTLDRNQFRTILLGLPTLREQKQISNTLNMLYSKVIITEEKLSVYQNLFKTLLHELMSEKRVIKI